MLLAGAGALTFCLGLRFYHRRSVLPEILEPIGSHVGVLTVCMMFLCPYSIAATGYRVRRWRAYSLWNAEAYGGGSGMELGDFSNPGNRFQKSRGCGRTAAFGEEDVSRLPCSRGVADEVP